MTASSDLPCEGACGGTGILHGQKDSATALDLVRLGQDVDNIARCDACAHEDNFVRPNHSYPGDYEAAKAVAAAAPGGGAWVVYVIDLDAGFPATEDPLMFVRHSLADVAELQRDLLDDAPQTRVPDCSDWVVVVEWVRG